MQQNWAAVSRIGRASVSLKDPVAYTAEGLIAAFCVEDGAQVKKGDVLFETVSGSYPVDAASLAQVTAPVSGVVSSVSLNRGSTVSSGTAVAEIYPDELLRIEASVPESDLSLFTVGREVSVELNYLDNGEYTVPGVIEKVIPHWNRLSLRRIGRSGIQRMDQAGQHRTPVLRSACNCHRIGFRSENRSGITPGYGNTVRRTAGPRAFSLFLYSSRFL